VAEGKSVNVKNTEVPSLFSMNLKSPLPVITLSKGVAECSAEAGMLKQRSISSGNSSLDYENLRKHHEVLLFDFETQAVGRNAS